MLRPQTMPITTSHDSTLIAAPSQRRYSCSQDMPASTKPICNKMASDTTTTRWKISFDRFRTHSASFQSVSIQYSKVCAR